MVVKWRPIAIREIGDDRDPTMFPVATDVTNGIVIEPTDGSFMTTPVTAFSLAYRAPSSTNAEKVASFADVNASLFITEARVAIACSGNDKGRRRRCRPRNDSQQHGGSVVGHIRHPWLARVGFSPKAGWVSSEQVRMMSAVDEADGVGLYALTLTLPKSSSEEIAAEIVRRAAYARLERTDLTAEQIEAAEALLQPPRLPTQKGKFAMWKIPAPLQVDEDTAFSGVDGVPVGQI